ncbi:MAG: hypothetical protein WC618_02935 [Patescibacteria group bacterium]
MASKILFKKINWKLVLFFLASFLVIMAAPVSVAAEDCVEGAVGDYAVVECSETCDNGDKEGYEFANLISNEVCTPPTQICCIFSNNPPDDNGTDGEGQAPAGGSGGSASGDSEESLGTGIINPCALRNPPTDSEGIGGYCDDVNDLLVQLIMIAENMFKVVGALAFFFFIYGGLTILLSMGDASKAKKGHQILLSAVIGLLIAFSAYLLIDFVLDAMGVVEGFRGIG